MSTLDEQVQLIEILKNELCNKIAPHHCSTIAPMLKADGKIFEDDLNEVVESQDTEKTRKMINLLLGRKVQGFYASFLTALQEAGLTDLRNEIEGKAEQPTQLQQRSKHFMELYFRQIVNKLNARDILLYRPEILDEQTRQKVLAETAGISQTAMFLHYLQKRNAKSIDTLLIALRSGDCGDYTHIVDLLEGKEKFSKSDEKVNMEILKKICTHSKRIQNELDPLHLRGHFSLDQSNWDAIERVRNRRERAIMFLNILANSDKLWFKWLIVALNSCEQHNYSDLCLKLEEEPENDEAASTSRIDVAMETDVWEVPMETEESVVTGEGNNDIGGIPFVDVEDRVGPVGEENHQLEMESSLLNNFDNPPVSPRQQNPSAAAEPGVREIVEKLVLRDYQLELATPALAGENSMIVAPTGSGKTFVALKICEEHIKQGENKKAIFLIPRVPLVRQQHKLFKRFLGDAPNLLLQVTGETSNRVPVNISLKSHKIAFMTPQILLNLLRDKLVKISDFSLLVIDECHHTVKDDPYNNIMKIYLDERLTDDSQVALPQIVGLTASPGMGKAKKMSQAEENIKTLMANLDVTKAPTRVNLALKNLKSFQNETNDQTISILRAPDDDFRQSISKSMDEIEELVEREINSHQNDLGGEIKFDLRAQKGSQDYEAWVITLKNKSKPLLNDGLSNRLMMYAEHLLVYNTALILNDHVRSSDAEDLLLRSMEKFQSDNPVCLDLKKIFDKNKVEPLKQVNDLLLKLHSVLLNEFREQDDSRCIIFVKTRSIASGVITYIEGERELMEFRLNPKLLTGAGVSGDKGGMTKREQESTLEAFRKGKCKVIVATSVAEEGLDIEACNLIITYNYSTNEVGHVQRKGRGRAANSQIVTLAYDDSGHVQKERENKIRVELTDDMLGTIREIPPERLKEQIREIQIKAKKQRVIERKTKARLKQLKKKSDQTFNLLCLWCKQQATTTQHLRHINNQHRVIVDPEFVRKVVYKTEKNPQKWKKLVDDNFVTGKMFCANACCRNHLGYRMKHKYLTLSVPKVTSFLFTDQSGGRETFDKWSQVSFKVKELSDRDLESLLPSEGIGNEIDDDVDYD